MYAISHHLIWWLRTRRDPTYVMPPHGWTCFHCGETFTTWGGARDHFGATPQAKPGCLIRVQLGDERGLQMELRKAESDVRLLREQLDATRGGGDRYRMVE